MHDALTNVNSKNGAAFNNYSAACINKSRKNCAFLHTLYNAHTRSSNKGANRNSTYGTLLHTLYNAHTNRNSDNGANFMDKSGTYSALLHTLHDALTNRNSTTGKCRYQ